VPFHVELNTGLNHARAFNLSREQLLTDVLAPWLEGLPVELGESEWLPAESKLKILEGPRLEGPDLAFGQGWSNAERVSEEVTRRELASAPAPRTPDAFVLEADDPDAAVEQIVQGQGAAPIAWSEAQGRIDGRDPEVAAVIFVVRRKA
jgi:hypothetical protein